LAEKLISFSATYSILEQISMEHVVFRGVISSAGSDKYGERRYAIYIPKGLNDNALSSRGVR
jgi:hypothetical protein